MAALLHMEVLGPCTLYHFLSVEGYETIFRGDNDLHEESSIAHLLREPPRPTPLSAPRIVRKAVVME